MQLPKLTPLQSRLLAFIVTTCLVVVPWISFQPSHFAYAAEIPVSPEAVQRSEFDTLIPPALPDEPPLDTQNGLVEDEEDNDDVLYAPDFAYFDRSLVGRQENDLKELNNNQMIGIDVMPNTTVHFRFKKGQLNSRTVSDDSQTARGARESINESSSLLEDDSAQDTAVEALLKRQAQKRLQISANTCRQPTPTVMLVTDPPPQLVLSVWTGNNKARPSNAKNATFVGGHVNYTLSTNDDVFLTVDAPALTQGWNGSWHFEIAATLGEGYFHDYDNATNFIFMVDTDSDSTLFITHNLTANNDTEEVAKWTEMHKDGKMPFDIYAFPDDEWNPLMGLERSFCGLKTQFETNNMSVATSITTNFGQGLPKGQFHVQGLKTSTNYTGFLALNGDANMTIDGTPVGKGGRVFKAFQWQTKADDSCQVIFGLDQCPSVAYAVPSSTQWKNNDAGLIAFYDGLAGSYMQNFTRSLAQVACDTTSTAQYSLARNCTDCKNDYRTWLCSVLIPRCEDWTATNDWLHPRNINTPFPNGTLPDSDGIDMKFNNTIRGKFAYNQSRNNEIDSVIQPGPYKELLPCEDLCFDIVRSCPAQMGFACPSEPMRQLSYGKRDPTGRDLKCNFPGAVVDLNQDRSAAGFMGARAGFALSMALFAIASSWM